jgi:hypothetical protein
MRFFSDRLYVRGGIISTPPINKDHNMGAVQSNNVTTRGVTSTIESAKKLDLLELRMRIMKVNEDEEKMMFAFSELGLEGQEWYVELTEKPQT